MRKSTSRPTVASELAEMIERCGKTHKQIAHEAGFPRPNVISMMKTGEMKVPIDKAPALATACGGDPVTFTRRVMEEYEPAAWAALEMTLGEPLTAAERDLLDLYREIAPDDEYEVNLVEVRQELEAMARETHGVPGDMVAFAIRAARFFGVRKRRDP
jgi:hypothetical protein